MESIKNGVVLIGTWITQALGLCLVIFIWIYGALSLYRQLELGYTMREMLTRTYEGEELNVAVDNSRMERRYKK